MRTFLEYLTEADEADGKLKHLQHVEDLHIDHGKSGFKHAVSELHRVKEHVESGKSNSSVTQKLDGCVHRDTLVVTKTGLKKISELTEDDYVKCYDVDTNKYSFYRNSNPSSSEGKKQFVKLTLENNSEIILTEDHPILINYDGSYEYVEAINCKGLAVR